MTTQQEIIYPTHFISTVLPQNDMYMYVSNVIYNYMYMFVLQMRVLDTLCTIINSIINSWCWLVSIFGKYYI